MFSRSLDDQLLIAFYFAMTSLSTVGFGDFYPVSDMERLVGGFGLLFGGAVFSFMSGMLIEAIITLGNIDNDIDDSDKLN